ncbi:hypothetical protein O0I10_008018 [Lichtheimia ornata]|uniref:Uncharacterized protein n=1 Tax=Lichtheimia ornata TaxID=688661 RepID=A0AAD7XTC3_9FUNG|nr:uncharacterized protein O0I10_008018 [Lichtheimia ornata]KAJ8656224.1 hypothetical protein O0I10_008018 [Lichtheimia ornata]
MAPLPPTYHTFDESRGLIPIKTLEKTIGKTLSKLYLYAGRLSPAPRRGRSSVQDFGKGCLFQVCELLDSFQEYKKNRYGYTTVPVGDLMPLDQYASLDTPLLGIQLTQLQGGQVLAFSFLHRMSDGLADATFITCLSCTLHNEDPPIEMYYDWQRPPFQPSPKYDHSIDYPVMSETYKRPTMKLDHDMKCIFVIDDDKANELKRQMEQEIQDHDFNITVRDAVTAFMYRVIVKAKRIKGKCDFVYVVGKRHAHPDKRLLQHFGNYFA